MNWICRLQGREEEGTKGGVTQDKSHCVRRPQIANGDGALTRVTGVMLATRGFLAIPHQCCEYARVGFVHELVQNWRPITLHLNRNERVQGAKWCKP